MKEKKKRVISFVLIILVLIGFAILLIWGVPVSKPKEDSGIDGSVDYEAHYAFIAENMEDRQWQMICEETKQYGSAAGVYVECMNEDFTSEYTREDYMKIAISMKVDGIILEGGNQEGLTELVDQAVDQGIPVVTLMTDCSDSKRQCFIETGKYNLGREYARQIIAAATKDTRKVLVLVNAAENDSSQNLIMSGIRDTLENEGNYLELELESEVVGSSEFDSAQAIRSRLLNEDVPDILICLNDQDTNNAYQVLVDYNMVKTVKLIGSSTTDTILKGIQKGSVQSVILADMDQTGMKCIEALGSYRESSYVSDYLALDAKVIWKDNVKEYLTDEEAD
ncbi:MAG: substrate-binding domain-containing protein [Lachnospiraceae bacterium]|nr:substrate-binding domain-containing protein [Lachnospiraceae bacterium]